MTFAYLKTVFAKAEISQNEADFITRSLSKAKRKM